MPPLPPHKPGESGEAYRQRVTAHDRTQAHEPLMVYVEPDDARKPTDAIPASLAFFAKHIKAICAIVTGITAAAFGLGATVGVYVKDISKKLDIVQALTSEELATKSDVEFIALKIRDSIEYDLQNKTGVKLNCPTITVKGLGWSPCDFVGLVAKTIKEPPEMKIPRKSKNKVPPAETRSD